MIESEIVRLYKYTITYNHGEKNEYDIILVSDNMKDLVDLIVDRDMIDPIGSNSKWFEIADFLWVAREDGKWYHLFDINEQDLAVKLGYDVQEQYWSVSFKNDAPESVKDVSELMWKFESEMEKIHTSEWEKSFASGGVLGNALYESKYVQEAIRKMRDNRMMHEAEEFDAAVNVIEKIIKGEIV
jgi:hypothetical protein